MVHVCSFLYFRLSGLTSVFGHCIPQDQVYDISHPANRLRLLLPAAQGYRYIPSALSSGCNRSYCRSFRPKSVVLSRINGMLSLAFGAGELDPALIERISDLLAAFTSQHTETSRLLPAACIPGLPSEHIV